MGRLFRYFSITDRDTKEARTCYFVRHGSADYSERNAKIYQGFGVNLSPLSAEGVQQVKRAAQDERLKGADVILSSPYTRALQTAAILSKELGVEIAIETDLHEWLANKSFLSTDNHRQSEARAIGPVWVFQKSEDCYL